MVRAEVLMGLGMGFHWRSLPVAQIECCSCKPFSPQSWSYRRKVGYIAAKSATSLHNLLSYLQLPKESCRCKDRTCKSAFAATSNVTLQRQNFAGSTNLNLRRRSLIVVWKMGGGVWDRVWCRDSSGLNSFVGAH